MKNFIRLPLLTLLLTYLSACSSILESEQAPERVYLLKPYLSPTLSTNDSEQKYISVSVSTTPGLDTDKILILEPDAHLNHYAAARWTDNTSEVLTSLFRDSLESSGAYLRATSKPLTVSDKLNIEIKEFYTLHDYQNNAESVKISLYAYLECKNTSNKKLTPLKLQAISKVNMNKLSEIVKAYQKALDQVSRDLLEQLIGTCS